jgi:hypothetical protein
MAGRDEDGDDVVVEHPNRKKASSKTARAVIVLLLVITIVLLLVVTVVGWDFLQGAKALQVGFIVAFAIATFYVLRWNRGVLPVTGALAIILGIFAIVSAPAWFDRDQAGFAQPAIDSDVLGLLCALLVPVEALLLICAMIAFQQAWNVEVERRRDDDEPGRAAPATA